MGRPNWISVGSDAMVDIRATLAAADEQGVIDQTSRDHLARLAKDLFYKDRSFDRLVQAARRLPEFEPWMSRFEDWLPNGKISQKRLDAEALLRKMAEATDDPPPPAFRFEVTTVWDAALRAIDDRKNIKDMGATLD